MSDVAWTDSPTRWWRPPTLALGGTAATTLAAALLGGPPEPAVVAWVGLVLTLVLLVTAWSARGYGRLRLTDDTLIVGRHRYPLAELDPGVLQAQVFLGRPLHAGEQGPDAAPIPHPHPAAGTWSPPFGVHSLLVRLRDGTWYAVATSDPMALLTELDRRATG